MEFLHWLWVMAHSLAYGAVPTLLLGSGLLLWAWQQGYGWYSLWAFPLAGGLVLLLAAGFGLLMPTQPTPPAPGTALRVAHLNTLFYSDLTPEKLGFSTQSGAQVVSLLEVHPSLAARLPTISGTYPFQQVSGGRLPMALLSIYPLTRAQAWGERAVLYHVARPAKQGGAFYVLQTHPQAPYLPNAVKERDAMLAEVAAALPNLPRPLLLVGDFNTTPWDTALRPLRAALPLAGGWRGWLPTFPAWFPLTPIDHVLASPHLGTSTAHRVRVAGSDHLGLVVDFQ